MSVKVALVHHGAALPSSRVRMIQLAPHLEARGFHVECLAYRDAIRRGPEADVVVLQKKLPSLFDARRIRAWGGKLVFDFDDAIPFRDRPKRGSYRSWSRRRKFERIVGLADRVVAGNAYLASLAPGARVEIIPSPVPHAVAQHAGGGAGPLRVGWIGSAKNLGELDAIAPALARIAKERALSVEIVSDATWSAPGVPVENVAWTLEGQEARVAGFDVGVMPLADTPWTRGKCGYKLLQYMAAGVAAVASDVGANREIVRHGENGLLAGDWEAALRSLLDDAAARARLGAAGRETVLARYTYEVVADRWAALLGAL